MGNFQLDSEFMPCGDQPKAIEQLVAGVKAEKESQVLLGVTGSGKTFTMAHTIAALDRPALILAHNKTLAAQLYQEFKHFFPSNAVEYFVSYYDYYQPEAYVARTDTYIEKDLSINDQIDRMRLSATRSLIERRDVLIVASISCIYGLGLPDYYRQMSLQCQVGEEQKLEDFLLRLVEMRYKRSSRELSRGSFSLRGNLLKIMPAYEESIAYQLRWRGNFVEEIGEIDALTSEMRRELTEMCIFPGSHHVTPEEVRQRAMESIRSEMEERLGFFRELGKSAEMQRIKDRTLADIEMIGEVGFCKGVENYSRHFSRKEVGEPPACLLDYFPDDFLTFIDESHQTLPQLRAMFNGDRARKRSLVEFGFRLPSAFDNRPLKFEEVWERTGSVIFVSATPGAWEIERSAGRVIEQIVRPTGLVDPLIEVRPVAQQVDDCLLEIGKATIKGHRILVTTLTKRLSEDLSKYLQDIGIKSCYLHSDIDTLERVRILKQLRKGTFDVLVGVNLLREGLDMPEVALVAILDADKEGFLRSQTSLIQMCGRAARNVEGKVIMYADKMNDSIRRAIEVTQGRRRVQEEYNSKHGIVPKTIRGRVAKDLLETFDPEGGKEEDWDSLSQQEIDKKLKEYEKEMKKAAKELRFDEATRLRDLYLKYKSL